MANHDVMLAGGTGFRQRGVLLDGHWVLIDQVVFKACELQARAFVAKCSGHKPLALNLYKQLVPYLKVIDEHDLCGLPMGLQMQILQRTIDQLEANG